MLFRFCKTATGSKPVFILFLDAIRTRKMSQNTEERSRLPDEILHCAIVVFYGRCSIDKKYIRLNTSAYNIVPHLVKNVLH